MRLKSYLSVLSKPPMPVLGTVSLLAWLTLLLNGYSVDASGKHTAMYTDIHAVAQSAWLWVVMLTAMMAPLLNDALHHIWVRSLARRRLRAISLFVIGYLGIWTIVGFVLSVAAAQLQTFSEDSWLLAPTISLLVALLWQISPWKQLCLNHCHLSARLSLAGLSADYDCLRFGVVKGFWCCGSCWALMFLPLIFTNISLLLMLAITFTIVLERYQPVRSIQWRIPTFEKISA